MQEDASLFKYNVSVAAIVKNEAPYIKEWIDYHLLAGIDHFYICNNESGDNLVEVLQPYIDKKIVTYASIAGSTAQMISYSEIVKYFKFESRYMAFIDADEFIFPKNNKSIPEVVDEILNGAQPDAVGLVMNWRMFGSSNEKNADLKRSVLDRFTHRAVDEFSIDKSRRCNFLVKTIANPRGIDLIVDPHYALYFHGLYAIDENGNPIAASCTPKTHDSKIRINHYFTKSREEFIQKIRRGRSDKNDVRPIEEFELYDRNEVFDDGIIKYRDARIKSIDQTPQLETSKVRNVRLLNALIANLAPIDKNPPDDFYINKIDRFLTCRAVARILRTETDLMNDDQLISIEKLLLECIKRSLNLNIANEPHQWLLLVEELPEILALHYPVVNDIKSIVRSKVLPQLMYFIRLQRTNELHWAQYKRFDCMLRLLQSI